MMVTQDKKNKSLLSVKDLSVSEVLKVYKRADELAALLNTSEISQFTNTLSGKVVVNLFIENSTRTRSSFEIAMRRLGGMVLNFAVTESSIHKGETLIDTAKNIEAMRAHVLVVRHSSAGAPEFLSKNLEMPIINAGDGFHEHPTQALLDVYTISKKFKNLEGLKVLIIGDIAHSRVARSNIYLMSLLGMKVTVCGPPTLLPPGSEALGVQTVYRPEDSLADTDVVMTLRIQFERQNRMQIPSVAEYAHYWGLNQVRAKMLKPSAIIMHPGPINRGVELSPEVADGENSVILDQVSNGVLIRMAVLERACGVAIPGGGRT